MTIPNPNIGAIDVAMNALWNHRDLLGRVRRRFASNKPHHPPGDERELRTTSSGSFFKAATILANSPSLLKNREYIFLLSHMRGYTTLLSHILGSHAEISGYAEARFSYHSSLDLLKLRCVTYHLGNYKPTCRYFLDKILHNQLSISDSILARKNIHIVFMIREPAATLKSMVAMHHRTLREGRTPSRFVPPTIEDALPQYIERLRMLSRIGERLRKFGKHASVIEADNVIENPSSVLNALEGFLKLRTPLLENYSVFDRTGTPVYGDPSEFIRKGRIERERPGYEEIAVPDTLLKQGRCAYGECLSALRDSFSHVHVQSVPS